MVLLDLDMPGLDGFSLAQQLRVDSPGKECFVIAATDNANKRCRRKYIEAGIDLVLIKPVDCEVIEMLLTLESERLGLLQPAGAAGAVRIGST